MAAKDPKLDLLHSIPLFSRLTHHELERLGQLADVVDLPAGRVLMRQGDPGAEVYVLVSGRVRITRNGDELGERGPGTVLGEIALLSNRPRTATAETVDATTAIVMARRDFHELLDEQPALRAAILDGLAHRLAELELDTAH